MRNILALTSLSLIAAACDSGPKTLAEPPTLRIISPERATQQDGIQAVTVHGEIGPSDDGEPVTSVKVNDKSATISADGKTFEAVVAIKPGANLIRTVATTEVGGTATDTRALQAGELRAVNGHIDDAVTAALSDEALGAIGKVASNMMATTDVADILAPKNPILKSGLEADGSEDCLFLKMSVYDLDSENPQIQLVPYNGGLRVVMDMDNVYIPAHARYAAACINGNDDLTIRANHFHMDAEVNVIPNGSGFDVEIGERNVDIDGLDMDATGVPGAILDLFNADDLMGQIAGFGAEALMGPMVNKALGALGGPKTLDVLGHAMTVDIKPSEIFFDTQGAQVTLNTDIGVAGAEDAKYVYTENHYPATDAGDGFEFQLADDMVNQLMAGFTAVGALKMEMPAPGGAFDHATLEATLPPMLSADPTDGHLRIVVGDMGMTFTLNNKPVAKAALNIMIDVAASSTATGIKLDLGEPKYYVDMVPDVDNQTPFNPDDIEDLVKISLDFTVGGLGALVGNVPLPAIGGVTMSNLEVKGIDGYLSISGTMQ